MVGKENAVSPQYRVTPVSDAWRMTAFITGDITNGVLSELTSCR